VVRAAEGITAFQMEIEVEKQNTYGKSALLGFSQVQHSVPVCKFLHNPMLYPHHNSRKPGRHVVPLPFT